MFLSNMITKDMFKMLLDCVKAKGTIIYKINDEKSNLFILNINGELKRYINAFEAFHNIYESYNCCLQMRYFLLQLQGGNEKIIKDKSTFVVSENKEVFDFIINYLYRNSVLISLAEWDMKNIESKINSLKLGNNDKYSLLSNILKNISDKYHSESSILNKNERVVAKKRFMDVYSFLKLLRNEITE